MVFSQEIISVLDYLCEKFGIAIDWTSENVMPYLEDLCGRYIQYEIYTSIAWIVLFGAVVIFVGLVWAISSIVYKKHINNDIAECTCYTSMFIFWIAFAICIIASAVQVFDIIECYTIPEKTILEYLKFLMNSASN